MQKVLISALCFGLLGCGQVETSSLTSGQRPSPASVGSGVSLFASGKGPITSQAEANQRFLSQFLKLSGDIAPRVIQGAGNAPMVEAYSVPGGELPVGQSLGQHGGEQTQILHTLEEPAYAFWVDGAPMQLLEHPCQLVYLRSKDGAIFVQDCRWDPILNGREPLEDLQVREANRVYQHSVYPAMRLQRDLQQAVRSRQLSVSDSVRPQGQGMPVERLYGIIIRGSPDVDDIVNKSKAQEIFDFMRDGLGARGYLEDLVSTTADPLTRGKVERAIHRLSHLRECDKFFLMTSGHGNGEDRYFDLGGAEDMRWSKLCAIISKNIRAGRICIVADNCHSGNIHEVFKLAPETWTEGRPGQHYHGGRGFHRRPVRAVRSRRHPSSSEAAGRTRGETDPGADRPGHGGSSGQQRGAAG